jgi:mRNA-degrading endonuclease RelE of RelBE toxin-antitoxin system
MPWELIVLPRAARDLAALPERDRMVVGQALDNLRNNPGQADLAKLSGRAGQWRLRVGRWRATLELRANEGRIYVLRVLPRKNAYR